MTVGFVICVNGSVVGLGASGTGIPVKDWEHVVLVIPNRLAYLGPPLSEARAAELGDGIEGVVERGVRHDYHARVSFLQKPTTLRDTPGAQANPRHSTNAPRTQVLDAQRCAVRISVLRVACRLVVAAMKLTTNAQQTLLNAHPDALHAKGAQYRPNDFR